MPRLRLPTGPTVHYTDTGPAQGARPTLVWSHGYLMDASMFDANLVDLSTDHRCIAWDARGHGQTVDDAEPFGYWDSARDLLALLDGLGIDTAVLIGMSQGGFVSLRAALLAPGRVQALVLLDSQAGLEAEDARPIYEANNRVWVTEGPSRELAELVAGMIIGPGPLADPWVNRWLELPKERNSAPFRALLDRDDLTARLPEIGCPALVVHGTHDISIPMERAEELAAGLPGCRGLVRIDGGTHAANLTHPAQVNAAIRAFVAAL